MVLGEGPGHQAHEVVEVHCPEGSQSVLVRRIDRRGDNVVPVDDLSLGGLECERDEGVLPQADALRDRGKVKPPFGACPVVAVFPHQSADDPKHVALVEDGESCRW